MSEHLAYTQFWNELMDGVFGPRKGGAKILMDAEDAMTGVGKTSGALALARIISRAFGYELQKEDLTLSGKEYVKRYRDHPGKEQPSVLVLDELVGGGAGDARRAMSHRNVTLVRAWNMLRAKRVVTICTLPDWNDADTNLQKLADYRVWCRKDPIGCFQAYEVKTHFNKKGNVKTKGLGPGDSTQRIFFPNLDKENDPFYEYLARKKDELLDKGTFDGDDLIEEDEGEDEDDGMDLIEQALLANAIKQREDVAWTKVPDYDDRLTYNGDYLRRAAKDVLDSSTKTQEEAAA